MSNWKKKAQHAMAIEVETGSPYDNVQLVSLLDFSKAKIFEGAEARRLCREAIAELPNVPMPMAARQTLADLYGSEVIRCASFGHLPFALAVKAEDGSVLRRVKTGTEYFWARVVDGRFVAGNDLIESNIKCGDCLTVDDPCAVMPKVLDAYHQQSASDQFTYGDIFERLGGVGLDCFCTLCDWMPVSDLEVVCLALAYASTKSLSWPCPQCGSELQWDPLDEEEEDDEPEGWEATSDATLNVLNDALQQLNIFDLGPVAALIGARALNIATATGLDIRSSVVEAARQIAGDRTVEVS